MSIIPPFLIALSYVASYMSFRVPKSIQLSILSTYMATLGFITGLVIIFVYPLFRDPDDHEYSGFTGSFLCRRLHDMDIPPLFLGAILIIVCGSMWAFMVSGYRDWVGAALMCLLAATALLLKFTYRESVHNVYIIALHVIILAIVHRYGMPWPMMVVMMAPVILTIFIIYMVSGGSSRGQIVPPFLWHTVRAVQVWEPLVFIVFAMVVGLKIKLYGLNKLIMT